MSNSREMQHLPLVFSEDDECDPAVIYLLKKEDRRWEKIRELILKNPCMDIKKIYQLADEECAS